MASGLAIVMRGKLNSNDALNNNKLIILFMIIYLLGNVLRSFAKLPILSALIIESIYRSI
jgi:hypothetical protein